MKLPIVPVLISLLLVAACGNKRTTNQCQLPNGNGIYYWKTTININDSLSNFLTKHDIKHLYLRLFDVVANESETPNGEDAIPNATLRFSNAINENWQDSLLYNTTITPTIYITIDALKKMDGKQEEWAKKIVTRVKNMCSYNYITNFGGIQLDCDWTKSTQDTYFSLCQCVANEMKAIWNDAPLSSTIRLHQLSQPTPPVDYGVLMVYNTGSFNNPHEANSILSRASVEPYLKHLSSYNLPLNVAYPTFSWCLLFRNGEFTGIISDINVNDTKGISPFGPNKYSVTDHIRCGDIELSPGDIIRQEQSNFNEIIEVKTLINEHLNSRLHYNIIYHLDYNNLSKYTHDEINALYSVAN